MTEKQLQEKSVFKYNMSFYYQSTIIYFVVFVLYGIIKGQFIDNSYTLIVKDPVLYFLGMIVVVSIISLVYNIIKNRHIEFDEAGIALVDRFKKRELSISKIENIKISKGRRSAKSKAFRLIFLKLKTRKRRIVIRPTDYENEDELMKRFIELQSDLNKK